MDKMVYIGKSDKLIYGKLYTVVLIPYHNGDFNNQNIMIVGSNGEYEANAKFDDFISLKEFRNDIINDILDG